MIATSVVSNAALLPTDERWHDALAERIRHGMRDTIAGSDAILIDASEKAALFHRTGAVAVDMESHIAARAAAALGLPFAALRVVSDGWRDVLPAAASSAIGPDGEVRTGAVLRSVVRNPSQIPDLIRTARNSSRAFATLVDCRNLLGSGLACPYLG